MHIIAPVIPILTFAVLWAIFYKAQHDGRSAFLSAAIIWGTYLVGVTELLSLMGALTFRWVLVLWTLGLLTALVWAAATIQDPRIFLAGLRWPDLPPFEAVLLAGCAAIAALIALTAWIAPPNSYDSMTYHMPRVMHWIQDRSVAYYPTHMLAQLFLTPGGDFFILHFQILAGSDRLANLVEWFSMLGSAIGVSLIARELGSGSRGQVFSAVASMTIPMGILQASGTEDNWITAFWLVCFVYWMLVLRKAGGNTFSLAASAASGASLGLAALCKATTYVFALPFLAWFGLSLLRTYRVKSVSRFGLIALIFVLINLGTYVRSSALFGNPLGMSQEVSILRPDMSFKYSNDLFTGPELVSNLIRNTSLHIGTPFSSLNAGLTGVIRSLHAWIGIAVDDPRTTWGGYKFSVPTLLFKDDTDGNLLHLILGAIAWVLMLAHPRRRQGLLLFALCVLSGYVIFCFYLKWQPYFSRLHLPLFVLSAPVLGALGDQIERRWIPCAISTVLILAALPWALFNHSRPLIGQENIFNMGRTSLYFRLRQPVLGRDYEGAVGFVVQESGGQCSSIGVYLDNNDYEYPLWVLLEQTTGSPIAVESVQVQNISAKASSTFPEFTPCAIFVINNLRPPSFQVHGALYLQAWTSEVMSVYLPK